jgi:Bacterial SH3 domain
VLIVVVVLGSALGVGIYLSGSRDNREAEKRVTTPSTVGATLPPPRAYKVTDGVNVRAGPGSTYAKVATVELGKEVLVICVTDGDNVQSAGGSSDQWLRVTVDNVSGYVTSLYVDTRGDLAGQAKIGRCPAT